ncbi:hypothetical protein F7Q99_28320 [Streptomyces kaniharaensis]|uniref:DUF732 domain-containing protein n=1 Tax=Streptomyces kaniharaensis TaxID=212423 RepID=A0A6N7KWK2_9ACTN|nr:hypothetical protein [Streptomyces kaniharaensis]MQS16042.1 hypothetical protein [Streptomyces kaniharaensis]
MRPTTCIAATLAMLAALTACVSTTTPTTTAPDDSPALRWARTQFLLADHATGNTLCHGRDRDGIESAIGYAMIHAPNDNIPDQDRRDAMRHVITVMCHSPSAPKTHQ